MSACNQNRSACVLTLLGETGQAKMSREETTIIELPERQRQELAKREPIAIDLQTKETYVLVRPEDYERLKELLYDDSPWTDEEMALLAEEAGELLDHFGRDE